MKLKLLLLQALFTLLFFSCKTEEPTPPEEKVDDFTTALNDTTNYWNRSTARQLNLNGKVKIMAIGNTVTNFNENGFITSKKESDGSYSSTFTYSNGKLSKSSEYFATFGTTTTSYEYNNKGKFVPYYAQGFLFDMNTIEMIHYPSLIKDLSAAIVSNKERIDYEFINDTTLLLINTRTDYYDNILKDTISFKYKGNYPVNYVWTITETYGGGYTSTSKRIGKNIAYSDNGMFLTFTYRNTVYPSDISYTFSPNNKILILQSIVTNTEKLSNIYNEYYDLLKSTYGTNSDDYYNKIDEYSDYTYDDHKNWTSRKLKHKDSYSSTWKNSTERRSISYW